MMRFFPGCAWRAILLALPLASASSLALAAPNLPRLDDPQLQGFLETLSAEYEQYLSSGNPHLERPSEIKAWPCPLTPVQLNRLAGTTNSDDDPPAKRRLALLARAMHTEPSKVVYSGQVFYPVQATCKNGELDGPVDFWVAYVETTDSPIYIQTAHRLVHARATLKQGMPIGLALKVSELLKLETKYKDPTMAAMMSAADAHNSIAIGFNASWEGGPSLSTEPPSVNLFHFDLDSNGQAKLIVAVSRPMEGNRLEVTQYGSFGDSTHKDYTTQYKDGRKHGPEIRYPGMMGTFPMPGAQTCWKDGEKVLADPCDGN